MTGGTVDSDGNRSGDSTIKITGDTTDAFGTGVFEISEIIYTTNSDGSVTANIKVTTPDGASYTLTPTSGGYTTVITDSSGNVTNYTISVNPGVFDFINSVTNYDVTISVPDGTTDGQGNFTLNGDGTYTISGLPEDSPLGDTLKISEIQYIKNPDGTYNATVTILTGNGYTLVSNSDGSYTATIIDNFGNISNFIITIDPGLITGLIDEVINNDVTKTIDNTNTNITDTVGKITDVTGNITDDISNINLDIDNIIVTPTAADTQTQTDSSVNRNDEDYTRKNSGDEKFGFQKGDYVDLDKGEHNLSSNDDADSGYTEENIFDDRQQSFDNRTDFGETIELSEVSDDNKKSSDKRKSDDDEEEEK